MAELVRQFHLEVEDKTGRLADMTEKLKDAGVNIRGLVAWCEGDLGHIIVLPYDPAKCEQIECPEAQKKEASEAVCVELPDRVGSLSEAARKLADAGIHINMCYAAATGGKALTIFQTSDNAKAAELL